MDYTTLTVDRPTLTALEKATEDIGVRVVTFTRRQSTGIGPILHFRFDDIPVLITAEMLEYEWVLRCFIIDKNKKKHFVLRRLYEIYTFDDMVSGVHLLVDNYHTKIRKLVTKGRL